MTAAIRPELGVKEAVLLPIFIGGIVALYALPIIIWATWYAQSVKLVLPETLLILGFFWSRSALGWKKLVKISDLL